MACNPPHTVEEINDGVQKLINGDNIRKEKVYEVSEMFSNARTAKEDLRKQYANCKDISPKRRAVIDKFLHDEVWKDYEIKKTLGRCVSQIQDKISHKIGWMHKENTMGGSSSQQATHEPMSHISSFPPAEEPVDENGFTEKQLYQHMPDEEALNEVLEEEARRQEEAARVQKAGEEERMKEQAEHDAFLLEFGVI